MSRYDEIYDDVVASLQKYCVDKATALGVEYLDWDMVSEVHELPDTDLLGPAGIGMTESSSGIFELVFGIGIASVNDPNLSRLRRAASQVFADFRIGKTIPIYRNETAQPIGWAVIEAGTSVTPISKSGSRPRQFVQAIALLDPSAPHRS